MLTEKAKAWNFYEEVESYDAAIRAKGNSSGWYVFNTESNRRKHHDGQLLHSQLCPNINWTPQRNLPTNTTNIYPPHC